MPNSKFFTENIKNFNKDRGIAEHENSGFKKFKNPAVYMLQAAIYSGANSVVKMLAKSGVMSFKDMIDVVKNLAKVIINYYYNYRHLILILESI